MAYWWFACDVMANCSRGALMQTEYSVHKLEIHWENVRLVFGRLRLKDKEKSRRQLSGCMEPDSRGPPDWGCIKVHLNQLFLLALMNFDLVKSLIFCDLLNVTIFCPRTEQLGIWDERYLWRVNSGIANIQFLSHSLMSKLRVRNLRPNFIQPKLASATTPKWWK